MQGIIYCAISPSNKKYYGKTIKTLNRRISHHLTRSRKSDFHFSQAIKKYGINSFMWQIIETYDINDKEQLDNILNEREKYWIAKDKTNIREYGYNMTEGGEKTNLFLGKKHSEETKQKMSKSKKGKSFSEQHKQNLSISIKKTKSLKTEQEKQKHRDSISGEHNGMFGMTGEKNPMFNKHHSKETINKIRLSLKQYYTNKNN